MGLFSFFRKKSANFTAEQICEKHDDDRMFPSGWYYENRHFIKEIEDQFRYFQNEYISAKKQEKGILAVRSALTSFVVYMEDVEKICASKGETFVEWSKLMVCNPNSMESYRKDLKNIEDNLDELIKKESLINWLKPELLRMVQEEPGVIQSDLYKRFDAELKPEVSNQLYLLHAKGLITREKSGRSYKLYIG